MNFTRHFLPRFLGAVAWPSGLGKRLVRALLALVVLLPITPSQAFSPANDTAVLPTWIKYSADAPAYFLNMTDRSLTFDIATNGPCVAYGGDMLYYSCQDPTTKVWTTTIVDSSVQVGEYAAVDYNSKNWPFITYYDSFNASLKLAYFNNDIKQWVIVPVPNVPDTGAKIETPGERSTTPLLDENGLIPPPSGEQVPGEQLPAEAPEAPVDVTPDEKQFTAVEEASPVDQPTADPAAAGATAEPVAQATPAPEVQQGDETSIVDLIQKVLQSWLQPNAPNFDFESIGYGKYTSIAIDRRDGVHISYHDEIDGALVYIYWDGYDWWYEIVDDPHDQGDVGLYSSITVDYYYNVYIAYYDDKYDNLKFAFHSASNPPNEEWDVEAVDGLDTRINMGPFASIALEQDLTGDNLKSFIVHISYYDFTHDTLRHAWRTWNSNSEQYVWNKEVVDSGGTKGNVGWYTSIAVDGNDVIHISYFDVGNGNLKYARKSGQGWTLSTLDSSGSSLTGLFTSIALNANQRPCISYLHGNSGELRVVCRTNTTNNTWTRSRVKAIGHDVGLSTSIAIDQNSQAHISYMDITSGALKYARSYGAIFGHTTFAAPYAGWYSSIEVFNGFPHIAYMEQQHQEVMYTINSSSGWTFSSVDTTYNVGQFVSMDLQSDGVPHMSYYDSTVDNLVYATRPLGATKWYTTTVDIEGQEVGWFSSLALDSANKPWIAYYDRSNGSLKIATRSPIGAWVPRTVESIGDLPEEGTGWYASLDIDNNNLPHVAYYDFTDHLLRYAYYTGEWGSVGAPGSWNFVTVDSGLDLDVGRFTSLAIERATGNRHICYYDLTNTNLKYAQWTPAEGWQLQVVDGAVGLDGDAINEGDVGMYCSIALSPTGLPVISYYDNSRGDLKVATSYVFPIPASGMLFLPAIYNGQN